MDVVAGFVLAAIVLTGSPGPNTLSLAAVGAAFGRAGGVRYMLGLNLGMVLVIAITGSGVAGLIFAVPGAGPVVTVIALGYFLYLAYRIATAPPLSGNPEPGSEPKWHAGVALSLLNPKAYAAMAAMYSGPVIIGEDVLADGLVKAGLLIGVIIVVNIGWLFAGAALTPFLRDPRASRTINLLFAAALIVSVGAVMLAELLGH